MTRQITIHLRADTATGREISAGQYTDLANAIWMFMRSTSYDFGIEPDQIADTAAMDRSWEQYGKDASWHQ